MNNEQKKKTKKLPSFYIALCCCVLAIGVAGYLTDKKENVPKDNFLTESNVTNDETDNSFSTALNDDNTYIPDKTVDVREASSASVTQEENDIPIVSDMPPVENYAVNNPDLDETAITVSSEQPTFIMPVNGNTLEVYSDKLKFNNALADWRTHNGIDIAANTGCSVQASADGVIDETGTDAMGDYVIISHSGGFITKYMGLGNVEPLTAGKEIKSGEVIGTTGKCKGENVSEPHIHFEMSKDGILVNPTDFLPQ